MKKYLTIPLAFLIGLFFVPNTFAAVLYEQPVSSIEGINPGNSSFQYNLNFTVDGNTLSRTTPLSGTITKISKIIDVNSNLNPDISLRLRGALCSVGNGDLNDYPIFDISNPNEARVDGIITYTWNIPNIDLNPNFCYRLQIVTSITSFNIFGTYSINPDFGLKLDDSSFDPLEQPYFKIEGTTPTFSLPVSQLTDDSSEIRSYISGVSSSLRAGQKLSGLNGSLRFIDLKISDCPTDCAVDLATSQPGLGEVSLYLFDDPYTQVAHYGFVGYNPNNKIASFKRWDSEGNFLPEGFDLDTNTNYSLVVNYNFTLTVHGSVIETDFPNGSIIRDFLNGWQEGSGTLEDLYFKIYDIPTLTFPISQLDKNTASDSSGPSWFQDLRGLENGPTVEMTGYIHSLTLHIENGAGKGFKIQGFDCVTFANNQMYTLTSPDSNIKADYTLYPPNPIPILPGRCFIFQPDATYPQPIIYGSSNPASYPFGEWTAGARTMKDAYFILNIASNIPVINNLIQLKLSTSTPIVESLTVTQSSISFKANLIDLQDDQVKLEIELKKFSDAFDGINTELSSLVDSGSDATVTINNLSDGDYHWRARAVDEDNNASDWQEFGAVGNTDFTIQKPVLIVPGLLGSFKSTKTDIDPTNTGYWKTEPIKKTYNAMFNAFDSNGYTPGEDLFTFPYNWEFTNTLTSSYLADKITQIKSICECEEVNVIAHSMGGLVARDYIEGDDYQNEIDKLFLLGTPSAGAPEAYLMWEGGEAGTPSIDLLVRHLAHQKIKDKFSYIREFVSSVKELLPVFDYLRPKSTGVLLDYPNGYPENTFLDDSYVFSINRPQNLTKLLNSGVEITAIAGDNDLNDTIGAFRVVDSTDPDKWEYGYPEGYNSISGDKGLELTSGDGTVTINSVHYLDLPNVENITISSPHVALPTNAFDEVFEKIRGEAVSPLVVYNPNQRYTTISAWSPVNIQVIDPLGRKTGKDFDTGQIIDEIPEAYYTGFDEENLEFVVIPLPIDGEYKILTKGTDSGNYTIEVNYIIDSERYSATDSFIGNTDSGVEAELKFILDGDVPEDTEVTPTDTTPPTTSISLSGTSGTNGWYTSDVTVSLSATDNTSGVGVHKTEYSLDNGTTWNAYTAPFTISNESANNTIEYRSEDYVGNIESTNTQTIKIDKTPPEAKIHFDPATKYFKINGADNLSVTTTTKQNDQNYTVTDDAGHTLKINLLAIYVPPHVTAGNAATETDASLDVIIKTIKYNSQPTITVPINNLHYEWTNTIVNGTSRLKTLTQSIAILGKVVLNSTYDSVTNKTVVNKLQGTTDITQILDGMVLPNLTTNGGVLGFEY